MDLVEIDLRRKINGLMNRSSIAFFLERDQMFFDLRFQSLPGNHEPIFFDGKFQGILLHSSQRKHDDDLLRRLIDIIRDIWCLLVVMHDADKKI